MTDSVVPCDFLDEFGKLDPAERIAGCETTIIGVGAIGRQVAAWNPSFAVMYPHWILSTINDSYIREYELGLLFNWKARRGH